MEFTYQEFSDRHAAVCAKIAESCLRHGRSVHDVELLPVTKTHPVAAAQYAHRMGCRAVGENRVQEAAEKKPLAPSDLRWELIGHLQSNKARPAAQLFDRIQSVDRIKLVQALERSAAETGRRLRILLQVNAGRDPAKFGAEIEDAPALLDAALSCPHLEVDGLMTIAPLSDDPDVARRTFARLREIREELAQSRGRPLLVLSMGMSGDLDAAIAEGSTLVRVGTALFGTRPPAESGQQG